MNEKECSARGTPILLPEGVCSLADSQITKKALACAVKALVCQKGVDKVSVGDITKECGMGRQSFYYHFQDKFELLEWVYQQEAFSGLSSDVTLQNLPQKMEQMLTIMEQERKFYITAIKAYPNLFSDCLGKILKQLFLQIIERLDSTHSVDVERREFGADFYAMGCCAVIVQWAQKGMRLPAEKLAQELYILAKDSERAAARMINEPK